MPKNGTGYADNAQLEIEKRLRKIYQDAQKELIKKLDEHTKQLNAMDKVKRQQLEDGQITEAQYKSWLRGQMFTGEQWKRKVDSLSETMLHANEQANAIIEGKRRAVFGKNYLYQARKISNDLNMGISFDLYDSSTVTRLLRDQPELLPRRKVDKEKDFAWNRENIANAVTQGIIQGDSIPELARRIAQKTAFHNRKATERYARTAMTGAQNAGRMEMLHEAQAMGIGVKKVWLATLDSRTRDAHAKLDGQEAEVDEPFKSEFGDIMYPGDPAANPANTWNCRCTLIYKYDNYVTLNADGVLLKAQTLQNATRYDQENGEVIGYKTYKEWAKASKTDNFVAESKTGTEALRVSEQKTNGVGYSVDDLLPKPVRPRKDDFESYEELQAAREKYHAELDAYNKRLDEVVEKAVNVKRFETKEDVLAWAEKHDIILTEETIDKIDIRVFNEASVALDDLFEKFPEVVHTTFTEYDGTIGHATFGIYAEDMGFDTLMEASSGITFNTQYYKNYADAVRGSLQGMVSGFNVKGDGTVQTCIRHEFGHGVDSHLRVQILERAGAPQVDYWQTKFSSKEEWMHARDFANKQLEQYEMELRQLAGLHGSSEYSNSTIPELFAEGFAEWSSGGKTEFAIKFGEFLKRWY